MLRAAFASASIAAALALGWACLPDLEVGPGPGAAPSVCGDGFIDPDAAEQCDPGEAGAAPGCSACKVVCDGGVIDDASSHCYLSLGFTHTDQDAVDQCEALGGHVVRVVDRAEELVATSAAQTDDVWIGLEEDSVSGAYLPREATNEPGWRAGCAGCYAHTDDAGAIGRDPASLVDAGGACVIAQKDVKKPWYQSACSGTVRVPLERETVCEREPAGTRATFCPDDVVCFTAAVTRATKSYFLTSQSMSAGDAAGACAAEQGRLVVLGSRAEREEVAGEIATQHVLAPAPSSFWIALSLGDAGRWGWDSDDAGLGMPPLTLWAFGEPSPAAAPGARAYLLVAPGTVDSELAHAAAPNETHHALCER